MTNNKDYSEEIIRKLVQKSELESPSDGFTDNIMHKIKLKSQIKGIQADPTFKVWQWLLIVIPGVLLVSGAFYYYWEEFSNMFDSRYITNTFIPFIKEMFGKGSEIMSQQEFSPILFIVIISAGFLMIIDRFVHFGRRMKSYLFTF